MTKLWLVSTLLSRLSDRTSGIAAKYIKNNSQQCMHIDVENIIDAQRISAQTVSSKKIVSILLLSSLVGMLIDKAVAYLAHKLLNIDTAYGIFGCIFWPLAVIFWIIYSMIQARRILARRFCPSCHVCGYFLIGQAYITCPECGAEVKRDESNTNSSTA